MKTRTKIAIAIAAIVAAALAAAGADIAATAIPAGAGTAPAPHCARTQELCNVTEFVITQPDGVNKVLTCYLTNPAYKPSPVSVRIAVEHCVSP